MNTITELAIAAARRDPLEPQSMADRAEHLADVVRYISENWPDVNFLQIECSKHGGDIVHVTDAKIISDLGTVRLSSQHDFLRIETTYRGVTVLALVKSWQP